MRFTYQPGNQPLAGYTIQRGIHCGGFGEVYFAHSDGGKEVALKLLHRLDQEIELRGVTQCLNLKHPNLVNLFDVRTDSHGDRWVVMEYVSGSSLEDVLASFPDGLPLDEVRDWLTGLVAGVSYLHERGIVHRDLKPANVYRENGLVKVGDVGLSKRLESDHRKAHTQSVGTVYYMAPEVARGEYGPEIDVYSLGVMLYELITGKLPFNGETTAEILMKHLTAQPDLSPIPRGLRPAIARALEKDPRKRTPNVRELERDFLKGLSGTIESERVEIPESSFLPPVPPRPVMSSTASPRISSPRTEDPPKQFERPLDRIPPHPQGMNSGPSFESEGRSFLTSNTTSKLVIIALGVLMALGRNRGIAISVVELVALGLAVAWFSKNERKTATPGQFPLADANPPRSMPEVAYRDVRSSRQRWSRRSASESALAVNQPFWSVRFPLLAHSLSVAAFVGSLLSAVIALLPQSTVWHRGLVFPQNENLVLFAAVTIFGSWVFLTGHALTAGSTWTWRQRWLARIASGALIGSAAYGIQQFLMVTIPPSPTSTKAIISSLGSQPLNGPMLNPTWLGYCCFFAAWAGLRRWNREMEPDRSKRLNAWVVAGAVLVAYCVTIVFKFPQWYAVLWAGTISTTVQLASGWNLRLGAWAAPAPIRTQLSSQPETLPQNDHRRKLACGLWCLVCVFGVCCVLAFLASFMVVAVRS